jgi:ATP-GRASP peptide maturase of grasp-with-spasm system
MILIITHFLDRSTIDICWWLKKYNHNYTIISELNNSVSVDTEIGNSQATETELTIDGNKILLSKITRAWLRKAIPLISPGALKGKFARPIHDEYQRLNEFLLWQLKKRNGIGFDFVADVNKLIILEAAKECGFLIPQSKIFFNCPIHIDALQESFITKPLGCGILTNNKKQLLASRTTRINQIDVEQQNADVPFFVQSEIRKAFELRIFFFVDVFWAMAIFSQSRKETEVDFRYYSLKEPTKMVPYQIPSNLEIRLKKLIELLKLTTGSFDIIVDESDNYHFLEVNPYGQFGFLSKTCNYNIEKVIAQKLAEYE